MEEEMIEENRISPVKLHRTESDPEKQKPPPTNQYDATMSEMDEYASEAELAEKIRKLQYTM